MAKSETLPRLMLVTDRTRAALSLPHLAARSAEGGVDAIQVREKDLPTDVLLPLVLAVRDAVAGRAAVLVNGNVEVARQLGIGIHLPEGGPCAVDVRTALGTNALIGRSVHATKNAHQTAATDYLLAGHVFATPSKPQAPPIGIRGLASIVDAARVPVLAIGGIKEETVASVIRAGAHGVAVISAINNAGDPRGAARRLRDLIDRHVLERQMNASCTTETIMLTINGKSLELEAGTTISGFLATKGLTERMVVVELNGSVLPRPAFKTTVLNGGDEVEIVHAVGGG